MTASTSATMRGMSHAWPFADLVLRTPRLELRPDDDAGLVELAARARDGVHDPATMPFLVPWTDGRDAEGFERGILQYHWGARAASTPEDWSLNFLVRHRGAVIGMQSLWGRRFTVLREVSTGSWLTLAVHGHGFGTEMRTAVLAFAFDGLDAVGARSAAFEDNVASARVSARLGYVDDGIDHHERRGRRAVVRRLRLSPAAFRRPDWTPEVEGLAPCRPLLGA